VDDSEPGKVEITIDPGGGEYRVRIHRCALGQLITVLESILQTLKSPERLPLGGTESRDGTLH
jgi:hypothetical protein